MGSELTDIRCPECHERNVYRYDNGDLICLNCLWNSVVTVSCTGTDDE